MTSDPYSPNFRYKKYSLEQLDNWVHDAVNCEDLSSQEIYDTIVKCVDESVEYHKKYLGKSVELLSLLKGNRPVDYVDLNTDEKDWEDFWEDSEAVSKHYTEEEMNAMCDAAAEQEEKDKCREYNLREAEYYNKRARLDADYKAIEAAGGYEWTPIQQNNDYEKSHHYYDTGRNKTHDQMIAEGWQMTDDGFWIKETDKGIASVSA